MTVIVIGARLPPELEAADCVLLADQEAALFDNDTEMWTVTTADGQQATAAIVVDARASADSTIAHHGVPNHFRIPGPNRHRQGRYVARCLKAVKRSGAARIEAKRAIRTPPRWGATAARFYITGAQPEPDGLYDGPASVDIAGEPAQCRVRLMGHLSAIDGLTHWQGTLFGAPPGQPNGRISLAIGGQMVSARIVERTPWGTHMIAGVGGPSFS